MRKALLVLVVLFLCVVIFINVGHKTQKTQNETSSISKYMIDGKAFYIPDIYLDFPYTSAGDKSGLLQMWFPGDAPVPDLSKEQKRELWHKNIRVLFIYYPKPDPQNAVYHILNDNKADIKKGIMYGLQHFTQSDDYDRIFRDDVWVDNSEVGSYIRCSKKQTEDDPVSMCSHLMYIDKLALKITYDQRLLADWKEIKLTVQNLFESFKSFESAQAYQNVH